MDSGFVFIVFCGLPIAFLCGLSFCLGYLRGAQKRIGLVSATSAPVRARVTDYASK